MTTHNVYNFKKAALKRKINISKVGALIVGTKNSKEVVLHVPSEYDYRYILDDKETFIDCFKLQFIERCPQGRLKFYQVTGGLKDFTTTEKDMKYNIKKVPDDSMRLRDSEVSGTSYTEDGESSDPEEETKERRDPSSDLQDEDEDDDDEDELNQLRETQVMFTSPGQESVTMEDFEIKGVIGRGTFGKVFLAELRTTKKLYAIKSLRKDVLVEAGQIENVKLEKDILMACNHQFLAGMEFVFQNDLRLYFVIEFLSGGELYKHFLKKRRFPEEEAKFYSAQIGLAIGHLHSQDIIHRDLKLENIMLNGDGFIKVIDFGLAKILNDDSQAMSFCGTPEYLAPEMVKQEGHDKTVDWWSLGILIYEMTIGVTPFFSKSRMSLITNIKKEEVIFPDKKKYKIDYSDDFVDIIKKLLDKDKSKRLGANGDIDEIMSHPYFATLDKEELLEKKMTPPFLPEINQKDKLSTYFKLKTDSKSVSDTIIDSRKQKKVKKNAAAFKDF